MGLLAQAVEEAAAEAEGEEWAGAAPRQAALAEALAKEDPAAPPPPPAADWAWVALAASGAACLALVASLKWAVKAVRKADGAAPPASLLEPLAPGEVTGAVTNPAFFGKV